MRWCADLGGIDISSLFVAGNGFDVAHGIPSKYSDFRSSIIEMYPEVVNLRDEVETTKEDAYKVDSFHK